MSATSPAINLEPRAASGQGEDVRAAVLQLAFRRKLWRLLALMTYGATAALALVCLTGVLDYRWPLPRIARIAALASLMSSLLLVFGYAFRQLFRRRALVLAAREIERAADVHGNALVTFCENLEGAAVEDGARYMLAFAAGAA